VCLGWARPSFQAKKSICCGTSIGNTKCGYAKIRYVVFAWDIVGLGD